MNVIKFLFLFGCLAAGCSAVHQYANTNRAPAFPLAVRTPYSSIWLPGDTLPGTWPSFWTGTTKGWLGLIRVDGITYEWMGAAHVQNDSPIKNLATQLASYITPTQTIFQLKAGPVNLNVTFISPVEYEDVRRASIPLSYVRVNIVSNDGQTHNVQLYVDITGEWGSSEESAIVTWKLSTSSTLKTWSTERQTQYKFAEWGDYPQWGQGILTASAEATHASGSDKNIRGAFVANGTLSNTNDPNFRCVSCDWPTFAFSHDLGNIGGESSKLVQYTAGHVREENINLMDVAQKALWTHYFTNVDEMIQFFYNDVDAAITYADKLDDKILNDAYLAEGQAYANVVSLSLRQAYGGLEFSGNQTFPIIYLKEISSNGNMQTVDVMYPATPVFYYLNVQYLKYLLEPLWYQMETPGLWPKPYAIHDIGFHTPNATGHPDGEQEDMPVEESANMIIMVGNIVFNPSTPLSEATAYILKHLPTLNGWVDYLYHNCLYPVNQLTTDDFIGHTELNSGLALKGILGMKTFAKLSELIGYTNGSNFYNAAVDNYIKIWFNESIHDDNTHLKMEYNVTNGYQFKYNAFQDKLLNLNTVPEEVYKMEAEYYLTKEEPYGIPFVSRHDYTKSDWEMWTAAGFGHASPVLRKNLVEALSRYLRYTPQRAPFGDWYVTATSNQHGFKSRPVVGGHFSILALNSRPQL